MSKVAFMHSGRWRAKTVDGCNQYNEDSEVVEDIITNKVQFPTLFDFDTYKEGSGYCCTKNKVIRCSLVILSQICDIECHSLFLNGSALLAKEYIYIQWPSR